MTSLRAISLSATVAGVLLGPSFVGFVHSVVENSVCLISSHICMISIDWHDFGKSVTGVTVERPKDTPTMTFLSLGIAKGTECRRNGNVLVFVGCDCSILLENVEPWNPKLLEFAAKDRYDFYKGNVDFLLNCLCIKFKNEQMENIGLRPIGLLANSGDQEYLQKSIQQHWRLRMLIHLHAIIINFRRADIQQAMSAAVCIFELGDITHNFLIGFCASLWGFGVIAYFQEALQQITQKARKQVFISEAEVVLAFQGNFSEKMHQMVRKVVSGDSVQLLLNSLDNISADCICVGVKMICGANDDWIAGITAFLSPKEKSTTIIDMGETNNTNNNVDNGWRVPRIFHKESSWRRMLNL